MDPARERATVISFLEAAIAPLLGQPSDIPLMPQEGISFGFALRSARDSSGVAAITGGIRDMGGNLHACGPCAFGTDEPAVRAILTAMRFDPSMRSAAVLQYSDRAREVFEDDLFLECASFAVTPERRGISTMDWGIAFCCKEGVPDVIYDKNPDMRQSRFVLFGEGAADVANNIIICLGRI